MECVSLVVESGMGGGPLRLGYLGKFGDPWGKYEIRIRCPGGGWGNLERVEVREAKISFPAREGQFQPVFDLDLDRKGCFWEQGEGSFVLRIAFGFTSPDYVPTSASGSQIAVELEGLSPESWEAIRRGEAFLRGVPVASSLVVTSDEVRRERRKSCWIS